MKTTSCLVPILFLASSASVTHAAPRIGGGRKRSLFCLGIFQECDEEEEDTTLELPCLGIFNDCENSTTIDTNLTVLVDEGDSLFGNFCLGIFTDCNRTTTEEKDGENFFENLFGGSFCLGIFQDCDDDGSSNIFVDCNETGDGVFGGRPLFGDCGVVPEFFNNIVNGTDEDGDGIADSIELESYFCNDEKDIFGLGLLSEGSLLCRVFNRNEDVGIVEAILDEFSVSTDQFSFGFLDEWSKNAVVTNATCTNDAAAPDCLDLAGQPGFWVCRTLTDPFNGEKNSRSVCIGEGNFLEGNDECGCCLANAIPTCPAPCGCSCDLPGDNAMQGVLVTVDPGFGLDTTDRCVQPDWAVSMTARFDRFACVDACSTA